MRRKETEEEYTREEERETAIKKMRTMWEKVKAKITDPEKYFDDAVLFNSVAIPVYTYN